MEEEERRRKNDDVWKDGRRERERKVVVSSGRGSVDRDREKGKKGKSRK